MNRHPKRRPPTRREELRECLRRVREARHISEAVRRALLADIGRELAG